MQALQKEFGAKDVVWLSVNSTSRDHPEYKDGAQMAAWMQKQGGAPRAVLIDGASTTGRAYAARRPRRTCSSSTPPASSSTRARSTTSARRIPADVKGANNYVQRGADRGDAGKPVTDREHGALRLQREVLKSRDRPRRGRPVGCRARIGGDPDRLHVPAGAAPWLACRLATLIVTGCGAADRPLQGYVEGEYVRSRRRSPAAAAARRCSAAAGRRRCAGVRAGARERSRRAPAGGAAIAGCAGTARQPRRPASGPPRCRRSPNSCGRRWPRATSPRRTSSASRSSSAPAAS